MRTGLQRALSAAIVLAVAAPGTARAQVNLPPPPPPPLGQEPPPVPPPAPRPAPAPQPAPPPAAPAPAPRRAPPPPAASPAPAPAPQRRRREPEIVEYDPPRSIALTVNPIDLTVGRLSGNFEVLLAPHHSLLASPNTLFFPGDRGGRYNAVSWGLGYATRDSSSLGLELGYHYWWRWSRDLRGLFAGPSFLMGSTTQATVGPNQAGAQTYFGAALDAGWQAVLSGGFTFGLGVGLGYVHLAEANEVYPRVLMQIGWSF